MHRANAARRAPAAPAFRARARDARPDASTSAWKNRHYKNRRYKNRRYKNRRYKNRRYKNRPRPLGPPPPSSPSKLTSSPSPPPPLHVPRTRRRRASMSQSTSTASLSLAVGASPRFTVSAAPNGVRTAVLAGAAVVSGLVYLLRRSHADGVRKRVIKRLDRIAPKTKYHPHKHAHGQIINADCPVCLCEFASTPDKPIRVLECRHALCSDCLEAWAVHCTKAHLNPSRFGITRAGRVVSWTPGPKCPLCCARLNCVPKEDLREAVIAAINHRGTALSTIIAYQSRHSTDDTFENSTTNWTASVASPSHQHQ